MVMFQKIFAKMNRKGYRQFSLATSMTENRDEEQRLVVFSDKSQYIQKSNFDAFLTPDFCK